MALSTTLYLWNCYRVPDESRFEAGGRPNSHCSLTKVGGIRRRKDPNIQAPSTSRRRAGALWRAAGEAPSPKVQTRCVQALDLGFWSFSGGWCLELGAYSRAHPHAVEPKLEPASRPGGGGPPHRPYLFPAKREGSRGASQKGSHLSGRD